jgi:hypothetical protein
MAALAAAGGVLVCAIIPCAFGETVVCKAWFVLGRRNAHIGEHPRGKRLAGNRWGEFERTFGIEQRSSHYLSHIGGGCAWRGLRAASHTKREQQGRFADSSDY